MTNNYFCYHIHSDHSNPTTVMDSVTKYNMYIDKAKELGMTSLAFSEHGNLFEWYHKKCDIEKAGMKYIHACEVYITKTLEEKIRDNRHCILIAKNYEGHKELNLLVSKAFQKDNHFYYNPRISYDELKATSDNIIITTACVGGILNSKDVEWAKDFVGFLKQNSDRCFLEIQHHNVTEQIEHNKKMQKIGERFGIRLVAGTDTHSLNAEYAEGREVLQKAKKTRFDNEEGWDLTFKSYDELVEAYKNQNALDSEVYLQAIENTNIIADMCEPYSIDCDLKYPKIYQDSENVFKEKIKSKLKENKYVRRHDINLVKERVRSEFETYKKVGAIDFILLQDYLREWERKNDILCGYSRGSVSGSYIAYLLGITQMDSIKFDLNFFRFLNPNRVSNADIDTDYSNEDREKVKSFILKDQMGLEKLHTSEIITFNTIALKGAIRDVARALEIPLEEVSQICNEAEADEDSARFKYPELFKYVDLLQGVIVSIGSHPSGVLITEKNIEEFISTCSIPTSDYPVSMLNMKELDTQSYVKLDILGLDAIGTINETCKMAGIERLTPDNVDLNDNVVWGEIIQDSTSVFQWESDSARAYLRQFMSPETLSKAKALNENFSMIKWLSFGNGLIRPACASYREDVARGIVRDNGIEELNKFLAQTLGNVTMQEDIMQFLVKFCGYSEAESDTVRRGIAKKYGTEKLLPEIEKRFIEYSSANYGISKESCEQIIKPFLEIILAASAYAFSWNHSDSYSCIGYIMGYLRHYYPLEYLCSLMNIKKSDMEYLSKTIAYAKSQNINIKPVKFGKSRANYNIDKSTNSIYQGVGSIKYLNSQCAEELYQLSQTQTFANFPALLTAVYGCTTVNSKQLDILIKLDYFSDYGGSQKLIDYVACYGEYNNKKTIKKDGKYSQPIDRIAKYCTKETAKQYSEFDSESLLQDLWLEVPNADIKVREKIKAQGEFLGYVTFSDQRLVNYYYVLDIITRPKSWIVQLYDIANGVEVRAKIKNGRYFVTNELKKGDIFHLISARQDYVWVFNKEIGKCIKSNDVELILEEWEVK